MDGVGVMDWVEVELRGMVFQAISYVLFVLTQKVPIPNSRDQQAGRMRKKWGVLFFRMP